MKRAFYNIFFALAFAMAFVIVGCVTAPQGTPAVTSTDPAQQAIDFTYNSYTSLDLAIKAADAAIKANRLKGQDAARAIAGLAAARVGLDAALAAMPPASGAGK